MRALAVGFFIMIAAACGGGGGSGDSGPEGIHLSPARFNLIQGKALTLSSDREGVVFTSRDPSIAKVDSAGRVTGVRVGMTSIVASSGTLRATATVGVMSPNPGATNLTLSGSAFYEDRPATLHGLTGEIIRKPIRHAGISVIAIDGFTTVASGATDEAGAFSFPPINNSKRRGGIYLQVKARTRRTNPTQIEIRNDIERHALYTQVSKGMDDSQTATFVPEIIARASGAGGAFNIFDLLFASSEWVQQMRGCGSATGACLPPGVVAYWKKGGELGTHFDLDRNAIFLCGGGTACGLGDSDAYDDAVIAHEYGHFILQHFSSDTSPGGVHFLFDNTQDIRLSWSEGWATFFSSAVRNDARHIDVSDNGVLSWEIERTTSPGHPTLAERAIYTTNELSVAATLWDVFDRPAGDDDTLQLGFAPIWEALLSMGKPATLESFHQHFIALHMGRDLYGELWATILKGRDIELSPDTYETDGEKKLDVGERQHHTLYSMEGGKDVDRVPFEARQRETYHLVTSNLTNGADTFLSVVDASGQRIMGLANDNRNAVRYDTVCSVSCPKNDTMILSSSLIFTWPNVATTLYAEVRHAPDAPPSAGRFGSYDLSLR